MAARNTKAKTNELVPDKVVLAEFGICAMTIQRWTADPKLGFPPAIKIRERNFRSREQLEQFKARMVQAALDARRGRPRKDDADLKRPRARASA
jgi:hypothetical protein